MGFLFQFDTYVIQIAFWVLIACGGGVSFFWPWWKTDTGWTITLEALGLTLLVFPTTVGLEFGVDVDTTFWQSVASASFVFIVLVMPWRAWTIWKRQRYIKKNGGGDGHDS